MPCATCLVTSTCAERQSHQIPGPPDTAPAATSSGGALGSLARTCLRGGKREPRIYGRPTQQREKAAVPNRDREPGCPAGSRAGKPPVQQVLEANHPVPAAPGPLSWAASLLRPHPTQRQGHHGSLERFSEHRVTLPGQGTQVFQTTWPHRGSGATREHPRGPSGPALVSPYVKPPRAPSKAWPFHLCDQREEPLVTPEEWHEGPSRQEPALTEAPSHLVGSWCSWSLPAQPWGLRPVGPRFPGVA